MKKVRQIFSIIAIVILVGLYVAVLIAAIFDDPKTFTFLKFAITGTIVIPALLWIIGMFVRLSNGQGQINLNLDEEESSPTEEEK
ncbi:MAG: hypothetical protein K6F00_09475 [Lachnospiraceae bacterium]|nr:hypothetical protein [Lachnospiraceae bacterium]